MQYRFKFAIHLIQLREKPLQFKIYSEFGVRKSLCGKIVSIFSFEWTDAHIHKYSLNEELTKCNFSLKFDIKINSILETKNFCFHQNEMSS